ncbi:HlyD family secretion protein [Pseudocolwellia agarivorans]|uniref:HlyD family secretion protein n=1 Tax=Pseudocolwellia agarivorans TaxID=1911682 RepID=UPI000984EC31|nr:HlyD family efflux transporter periplasmic adaptor subunit [Pseudocolwellia agarivorans]
MQGGLFRKEVIDNQNNRLHGDVILLPKFSHTILIISLIFWIIAVAIWLINSSYERKETVVGWITPDNGIIKVYSKKAGVINKILVKEGQKVQKGQPLLIIGNDKNLADGHELEATLLNEYDSQRLLIKAQLVRANEIYQMRLISLHQKINSSKQNLSLLSKQIVSANIRYQTQLNKTAQLTTLKNQGHINQNDLDKAKEKELLLKSEVEELSRTHLNQKNQITQLTSDTKLLPVQNLNEIDQLKEKLSKIAQNVTNIRGEQSYVVKASKLGTITNLQAIEGQSTNSALPLLTIIPSNSVLQAKLLIPVSASGFLAQGQDIKIRYDAFPYQKFGTYSGKILQISNSVLLPGELVTPTIKVTQPVYLVVAHLASPHVKAFGKNIDLKAGMTLSTDITLEERTLIEWLLSPIYSLKGKM